MKVKLTNSKGEQINDALRDVLVFDTETTGLPPKGAKWDTDYKEYPRVAQIAWRINDKKRMAIIKLFDRGMSDGATETTGITDEFLQAKGIDFAKVAPEFFADCLTAKVIVAHNMCFDTSVIKAQTLAMFGSESKLYAECERALDKNKRIDTMMKSIKFVGAQFTDGRKGKFPNLTELYAKCFNGEVFPGAHDAFNDVDALYKCLPVLVENGVIRLEPKATEKTEPKTEAKQKKIAHAQESAKASAQRLMIEDDEF